MTLSQEEIGPRELRKLDKRQESRLVTVGSARKSTLMGHLLCLVGQVSPASPAFAKLWNHQPSSKITTHYQPSSKSIQNHQPSKNEVQTASQVRERVQRDGQGGHSIHIPFRNISINTPLITWLGYQLLWDIDGILMGY